MKPKEFSEATREYNKQYRALFGYIPSIRDYSCTQEAYIDALADAVRDQKKLCNYLNKYGNPLSANSEK